MKNLPREISEVSSKLAAALAYLFATEEGVNHSVLYTYNNDFEDAVIPEGYAVRVTVEYIKLEDIA